MINVDKFTGLVNKLQFRKDDGFKKLQSIIQKQSQLISFMMDQYETLERKYGCIRTDRDLLLTQNNQLKKRLENMELNSALEIQDFVLKKKDNSHMSPIFEQLNKFEESQLQMIEPNSSQRQKSQLDMIEFISGQKVINSISCSKQARTPILHQPIFKDKIFRTKYNLQGLLRAFYIKILTYPHYLIKLIEIIEQEYKYGDVQDMYLFDKYPNNQFIGDMMIEFLKDVNDLKKYCQLLEILNKFQLYDDILVQIFLNKLKVYASITTEELDQKTTQRCFFALANSFDLEFQMRGGTAYFYEECNRRIPSQESQYQYNVYEEISLNPKPPKESISCIQKEEKAALFSIDLLQTLECFQFKVRQEKLVDELMLSQGLCLSKTISDHQPGAFDGSSNQEIHQNNRHFVDIPSILSQSAQTSENKDEDSIEVIQKAKKKYQKLQRGSIESILLSGYTSNRVSQEPLGKKLFKGQKQNTLSARKYQTNMKIEEQYKNSSDPSSVLMSVDTNRNRILEEESFQI